MRRRARAARGAGRANWSSCTVAFWRRRHAACSHTTCTTSVSHTPTSPISSNLYYSFVNCSLSVNGGLFERMCFYSVSIVEKSECVYCRNADDDLTGGGWAGRRGLERPLAAVAGPGRLHSARPPALPALPALSALSAQPARRRAAGVMRRDATCRGAWRCSWVIPAHTRTCTIRELCI